MTTSLNNALLANVGLRDRFARVLVGTFFLSGVFMGTSAWGWIGLYPLLTGVFAICPIYAALGSNTHRKPTR